MALALVGLFHELRACVCLVHYARKSTAVVALLRHAYLSVCLFVSLSVCEICVHVCLVHYELSSAAFLPLLL